MSSEEAKFPGHISDVNRIDSESVENSIQNDAQIPESLDETNTASNLTEQRSRKVHEVSRNDCDFQNVECESTVIPAETDEKEDVMSNSNDAKEVIHNTERLSMLQKASEKLHSPFYWQADLYIQTYGDHDIDLLTDFEEMFEETSFKFRRYVTLTLQPLYSISSS